MSVISVENLTKDYGRGRGIFGVSLEVERGEIYGYVGTNGSGKTTTIRNMLGFVFPDSGTVRIEGLDPAKQAAELMRHVSYIPGEIAFPNLSTGTEFLKLQAKYNGITDFTYMNCVADKLDLDTSANLKRMSKGMKQKTAIVAALMADRDILILDEPTTGLDPLQRDNFLELLRDEKKKGKTIFLSGHIFEELEEVCDRVAMLKDGHILGVLSMHDLRHKSDRNYEIIFDAPQGASSFAARMPGAKADGCKASLSVPPEKSDDLFKALAGYTVMSIKESNVTLEDMFMKEYRK